MPKLDGVGSLTRQGAALIAGVVIGAAVFGTARANVGGGDDPEPAVFSVGADASSIAPRPDDFGGRWQTEGCTALDEGHVDEDHVVPDPAEVAGWPAASPDCIYLGGFGIGPARPASGVGHGGVWIRSLAVSNGDTTFVYQIADLVGWFARYDSSVCADCGILDVRETLAADLQLPVGNIVIGSTHTHAGADTYGGWGGIPDWYRAQIRDTAIASAKAAVAAMAPAVVEVGEVHLRDHNKQRRDTYWSTADTGATWFQARSTTPGPPGEVIATWSTYAGHPTIVDEAVLHADWPGAAARWFEDQAGGVGLVFEGGLGNVSIDGGDESLLTGPRAELVGDQRSAEATGAAFAADVLADIDDGGTLLDDTTMTAAVEDLEHPTMTNPGLVTLASAGLFDREFTPGTPGAGLPGVYDGTKGAEGRRCSSAGPTVRTTAGAHRIGGFVVAFTPGEIFSNLAEVVKEEADGSAATMVLGQTNDALGYIIQSFEFDAAANAATHYGSDGHAAEYEEVFSIDRCLGDHVLDVLLRTTGRLDR